MTINTITTEYYVKTKDIKDKFPDLSIYTNNSNKFTTNIVDAKFEKAKSAPKMNLLTL